MEHISLIKEQNVNYVKIEKKKSSGVLQNHPLSFLVSFKGQTYQRKML